MVNSENFADRLQMLFDYYELTAGAFADEIEVGRPSVSHILSGRNKPSLDFVMKVVKRFKEVDLYWLLNGKGSFPSLPKNSALPNISSDTKETIVNTESNQDSFSNSISDKSMDSETLQEENVSIKTESKKKVSKVIILYQDGSFEIFDKLHGL